MGVCKIAVARRVGTHTLVWTNMEGWDDVVFQRHIVPSAIGTRPKDRLTKQEKGSKNP